MFRAPRNALSAEKLDAIERRVIEDAEAGRGETAWRSAQLLARAQRHQREAAVRLAKIVERRCLTIETGLTALAEIERAHRDDLELLALVGEALEGARDIDQLNLAPPEHPLFERVVAKLADAAGDTAGTPAEPRVLSGLATAARLLARQRDPVAEKSYRRLIELDPANSSAHYNYGLFLKTRGRFEAGLRANQTAAQLAREPVESYQWNLGICATGAGQGEVALEVWQRMGQKIELGRFGLPEGGYPQCKVRLAERPLAERGAENDDPGREETIWIQRLSPCHGIVRSVLYQELGVDFGDVVLFDGAPITYHMYGDTEIPVFPHLGTLVRRHYRLYDFAGTQDEPRRLADASMDLAGDAIVYSHSETYRVLCTDCWRNPDIDHEQHDEIEWHVVTGRIAAPPEIEAAELLRQLDTAIANRDPCTVYSPALCEAAGLPDRAAVERRRFELLRNDQRR